jgi:hypothetical protein
LHCGHGRLALLRGRTRRTVLRRSTDFRAASQACLDAIYPQLPTVPPPFSHHSSKVAERPATARIGRQSHLRKRLPGLPQIRHHFLPVRSHLSLAFGNTVNTSPTRSAYQYVETLHRTMRTFLVITAAPYPGRLAAECMPTSSAQRMPSAPWPVSACACWQMRSGVLP